MLAAEPDRQKPDKAHGALSGFWRWLEQGLRLFNHLFVGIPRGMTQ